MEHINGVQRIIIVIVRPGGVGGARRHVDPFDELRVGVHEEPVQPGTVGAIHRRIQIRVEKNAVGAGETNLHGLLGRMLDRIELDRTVVVLLCYDFLLQNITKLD